MMRIACFLKRWPSALFLALFAFPMTHGCGDELTPFQTDNPPVETSDDIPSDNPDNPVDDADPSVSQSGESTDMPADSFLEQTDGYDDSGLPAVMPRFELDSDSFYGLPWPSDYRVDETGRLELDDFPQAWQTVVAMYVRVIEEEVSGFGTMPVVYMGFEETVGTESLPEPSRTLSAASPLQLIDVSEEGCGDHIPVEVQFEADGDEFRDPNVLMASPVPGYPLRASTPYAFIVLRSFGAESGVQTAVPEGFDEVFSDQSGGSAFSSTYAPLRDCLSQTSIPSSSIAVATVFTTQDPVEELRILRDMVIDPTRIADPTISGWTLVENKSVDGSYTTYSGTYDTPIFQRGTTPYAYFGGGIRFDDSGEPIVQRWEEVPFVLTVPDGPGPFPVLVWSDGTGARLYSHIGGDVVQDALADGFAVASFQPQFHGDRSGPEADSTLHTFNYFNPESGRSVFRQQAVDTSYFVRVVRTALPLQTGVPVLDTERLVYGGHSQGALVGGILAGVEAEFVAYVLNGIGAYLSITIVERKDPVDLNAEIQQLLGISEPLDRFHPVVALAQLGCEVADPINYAIHWRGWEGHEDGSSVFLLNGQLDHTTPERSVNSMTVAGDLVPIAPAGWDVDPFDVWDVASVNLPIGYTATSIGGERLTMITYLSASTGHFTIYDIDEARAMALDFWLSALSGTPILLAVY